MRVAALDFGTNTFLLLVADVENGRVVRVLHDEARVVRLGQGVHQNRKFHPEALARAETCLNAFSRVILEHRPERILACATSAARDVSNSRELIELGAKLGIPVEIISGEREGELTFWGSIDDSKTEPTLIVDVGGGSTEFILGDRSGVRTRRSIDVGSVRLTELFVTGHPISPIELARMTGYTQERITAIRSAFDDFQTSRLLAVAGTPTTLAAMDLGMTFESDRVHGHVITLGSIRQWLQRLSSMSVAERQALAGMEPKRADVIVAGVLILMLSMQSFGAHELEVSTRGLRYGIALDLGRGLQ